MRLCACMHCKQACVCMCEAVIKSVGFDLGAGNIRLLSVV